MAKKNKSKGASGFSAIGGLLDDLTDKTAIRIEHRDRKEKRTFISSGVYVLNALLSGSILSGGIVSNRITMLAGEEATGKSFICYQVCKEAQKAGYGVIYIDTEDSIDPDDLERLGIDTHSDNFRLLKSNILEDLKIMLAKFLDNLKEQKQSGQEFQPFIIILDSLGQMASRKELNDAIEGKETADMTRAKVIKSLFRIINSDLGYLRIPMLITNHVYKDLGAANPKYAEHIMPGGKGAYYSASTIVFLSKAKDQSTKDDVDSDISLNYNGIVVTAKAKKNRMAAPRKVKFSINFETGCNPYDGLEMFCTPENYEQVGIAKGKEEVNKETGEVTFKPGGHRWYVRHLGKTVWTKDLHVPEVFTPEVLESLDPIIAEYFRFGKKEDPSEYQIELEGIEDDMDAMMKIDIEDDDIEDLDYYDEIDDGLDDEE